MIFLSPYNCSDGVGRTGTFLIIHSQVERLKTEGVVDFLQAIKSARLQRAGLVSVPVSLHSITNLCGCVVAGGGGRLYYTTSL